MRPIGALALVAGALAGPGCGSGGITGPAPAPIQPGVYVLSAIAGLPAPYVVERSEFGDSLAASLSFAFDSIVILNDTTFTRHFRRVIVVDRPPLPPLIQPLDEFSFGGLVLDRGAEIKLTVRAGQLPGGHDQAYFTPSRTRDTLYRSLRFRTLHCTATRCELQSEQRVQALYARQ